MQLNINYYTNMIISQVFGYFGSLYEMVKFIFDLEDY